LNVSITRTAKRDIAGAMAWYEKQQEGLGNRFVEAVDQAIAKIT
jgi:hypothetical protein